MGYRLLFVLLLCFFSITHSFTQDKLLSVGVKYGYILYDKQGNEYVNYDQNYLIGVTGDLMFSKYAGLRIGYYYETKNWEESYLGSYDKRLYKYSFAYNSFPIEVKLCLLSNKRIQLNFLTGIIVSKQRKAGVKFYRNGEFYSDKFFYKCYWKETTVHMDASIEFLLYFGRNWGIGAQPQYRYKLSKEDYSSCFFQCKHAYTFSFKLFYNFIDREKVKKYVKELPAIPRQ